MSHGEGQDLLPSCPCPFPCPILPGREDYVAANVGGTIESPVHAILDMAERVPEIELPAGVELAQFYRDEP